MMHPLSLWTLLGIVTSSHAGFDLGWASNSDVDLTNFVTRPELKAPKFNVAIYDWDKLTPGYWFLGPYAEIQQKPNAPK